MSDEEDFDEFPSITVNSSLHGSSSFSMPSAGEVAEARAREAACERALLRLRAEHDTHDKQSQCGMLAMAHSDSSGSEGEAALAAAVCALRVRASGTSAAPRALDVLAALRNQLSEDAGVLLTEYTDTLAQGNEAVIRAVTIEIASSISEMAVEAASARDVSVWGADEVCAAAAWLCVAAVACLAPRPPLLARTLHLLLDDVATDQQLETLSSVLVSADLDEQAGLELSDILRSGSERTATLARALAERSLARLAGVTDAQNMNMAGIVGSLGGAWRRLPPPRQYLALQLLSRLWGQEGGDGGEAGRLLDALAQPAPGQRTQSTDTLKYDGEALGLELQGSKAPS